jgi:hypothetical protein
MPRISENSSRCSLFDYSPGIHNCHTIGGPGDDAKIVRDKQEAHVALLLLPSK